MLFAAPLISLSQNNFKPGFIVKNTGDTVNGFIEEGNERKLAETVAFKKDVAQTESQKLTVKDITSFGYYDGNVFVKIAYNGPEENTQGVSFAKYLLKGHYRLYAFLKDEHRYFIIKTPEDSTYLLYDDIYTVASGIVLQTGNFKNVLAFVAGNCDNLRNRVQETGYDETDILDFVKQVNNCVSPSAANEVLYKKPKTETYVYAYAGGLYVGAGYEFTGRIILRSVLPSVDRKTSLNVGINYMDNYKTQTFHAFYLGQSSVITAKSKVSSGILSIPLTLQYYFAKGKVQPYFDGGFCFDRATQTGLLDADLNASPKTITNSLTYVAAVGVDFVFNPNLAIKADWRYEFLTQYPTIGVAYTF
jgi:hypothetical protein